MERRCVVVVDRRLRCAVLWILLWMSFSWIGVSADDGRLSVLVEMGRCSVDWHGLCRVVLENEKSNRRSYLIVSSNKKVALVSSKKKGRSL